MTLLHCAAEHLWMCEDTLSTCTLLFCTVGENGINMLPALVSVGTQGCNQHFYKFVNIVLGLREGKRLCIFWPFSC